MSRPRSLVTVGCLMMAVLLAVLPGCASPAPASPTAAPPKAAAPAPTSPPAAPAAPTTAAPAPAAPTVAAAAPAPAATAAPAVAAKVSEYNVFVVTDNTGPGAQTTPPLDAGRKAVLAWWNETRGKELGIKINAKFYDLRNDPSLVASTWAGALGSEKPIFIAGYGGADSSPLQGRLPADKVPSFIGSVAGGFNWNPDQWVFFGQATYVHHATGFFNWQLANWKENRPIRLGQMGSEENATTKDSIVGMQSNLTKGLYAGKVEEAGTEWVPLAATDVSNSVKRLIDKKSDFIRAVIPYGVAVALVRALQQYKADNIKVLLPFGTGVGVVARGLSLQDMEGHFDVTGYASEVDTDIEAAKLFDQYKDRVGAGSFAWQNNVVWGMTNVLLPLRAVERAAKAVGPDRIDGQAVYNAMLAGPFAVKDFLGLTGGDLSYGKTAPFPTGAYRVRINTVKNGKIQLATPDWVATSDVAKW